MMSSSIFRIFLRKIVVQRYGNVTDFENSQEIFSKKEKNIYEFKRLNHTLLLGKEGRVCNLFQKKVFEKFAISKIMPTFASQLRK